MYDNLLKVSRLIFPYSIFSVWALLYFRLCLSVACHTGPSLCSLLLLLSLAFPFIQFSMISCVTRDVILLFVVAQYPVIILIWQALFKEREELLHCSGCSWYQLIISALSCFLWLNKSAAFLLTFFPACPQVKCESNCCFSIELWALQSVTCCSIKKSAKPELIVSLHWALSWLVFKKTLNYFSFFFMCVLLPLERSQVALVFLCHMTWNWWPSVSAHLAWRLMIWALGSDGPGWNAKGYEHGNTYSHIQ